MIYLINKYHRTDVGETAAFEKIEKATDKEAIEKTMEKFFQFAANYMADTSVLEFSLMVVEPRSASVVEARHFVKQAEPTEEPVI